MAESLFLERKKKAEGKNRTGNDKSCEIFAGRDIGNCSDCGFGFYYFRLDFGRCSL